jgi:hypothetical protein
MLRSIVSVAALVLMFGCAEPDPIEVAEVDASAALDPGKADGATEVKVRAGETSLWVRTEVAVRQGDVPELVLRGRTSRNIVDGTAFVFDDVYGDFAAIAPRTFEVTWPVSTARGLLDGVDQFVRLQFVPSPTRPEHLTSHVVVRPRLRGFSGSSSLFLVAELRPVHVAGQVVYRLTGAANDHVFSVDAHAGGLDLLDVRTTDDTHFTVDIPANTALDLLASGTPIAVRAHMVDGVAEKSAVLGAGLHDLGFTDGDPYEVWPRSCEDETLACLQALPVGTLDLSSCGDAMAVTACATEIGVFVSATDVAERIDEAHARVADPSGFAADASALVGSDRVDALVAQTSSTLTETVQATQGRWFLDAQALDAGVDAAIETALDRTYAYPTTGFDPRPPAPGDVPATRQLVADALLAYLAEQDYLHSEFGRSYLELARVFRAQHIASLRNFRETVAREDYPGMPHLDVYVADWIGAYTEVSVEKTTGEVTLVYVELD